MKKVLFIIVLLFGWLSTCFAQSYRIEFTNGKKKRRLGVNEQIVFRLSPNTSINTDQRQGKVIKITSDSLYVRIGIPAGVWKSTPVVYGFVLSDFEMIAFRTTTRKIGRIFVGSMNKTAFPPMFKEFSSTSGWLARIVKK